MWTTGVLEACQEGSTHLHYCVQGFFSSRSFWRNRFFSRTCFFINRGFYSSSRFLNYITWKSRGSSRLCWFLSNHRINSLPRCLQLAGANLPFLQALVARANSWLPLLWQYCPMFTPSFNKIFPCLFLEWALHSVFSAVHKQLKCLLDPLHPSHTGWSSWVSRKGCVCLIFC